MSHARTSLPPARFFLFGVAILAAAPAVADTLYGAAHTGGSASPSTLYRIDDTNGSVTPIGPIGFNAVGGMDFQPVERVLYAVGKDGSGTNVLITIDTASGQGIQVAELTGVDTGAFGGLFDLSFRNSDRVLFLSALDDPDVATYTVDIETGVATLVGFSGYMGSGNGLGFSLSDTLFLTSSQDLVSLNQTTGVGTGVTSLSFGGFPPLTNPRLTAIDFRPADGEAFVAVNAATGGGGPTYVGIADMVTGVVRQQGVTVNGLDALAWLPDEPEVPVGLLFGGASAGGPTSASTLYEIDPATGSSKAIGSIGFNGIGGLDFHPDNKRLFGVAKRPGDGVDVLIDVNPATGAGSEIGPLLNIAPAAGGLDLSFRPDGALFLSAILPGNNVAIYSVNQATGEAIQIGDTLASGSGNGIAYGPGDRLHFGSGATLYEVDDTNGTTSSPAAIAYMGFPALADPRIAAIDFSAAYDLPFAAIDDGISGSGPNYLAYFDTSSSTVFNLGRTIDGLTALAWRPQRDPCAGLVFGAGRTGSGISPSVFYEIDPSNGVASPLAMIGFNEVRGMAMEPRTRRLFAIGRRESDDEPVLITIDIITGKGEEVGPLTHTDFSGGHFDLGFRRSDGVLFMLAQDGASAKTLYTVDLDTGEATAVGATTTSGAGNGLAFALDDTLFHVDDASGGTLRTVNTATGVSGSGIAVTYSGFPTLIGPQPNALAVDHIAGTMYVAVDDGTGSAGPNYFASLDTTTGTATHIGRSADGLDALEVYAGCEDLDSCTVETCVTCQALLYGASHRGGAFGRSTLYLIDPVDGSTKPVGPVGFNAVGGMDFHPGTGVLYAVARRATDGVSVLIAINPLSGTASEIGPLLNTNTSFSENHYDISFRGSTHVLYLSAIDPSGDLSVFTIDTATGEATAVGATGTTGSDQGLANSIADDTYLADETNAGTLSTVALASGIATAASTLTYNGFPTLVAPRPNAVDFQICDPATATISIDDGPAGFGPNYLATLDVATGSVDYLGTTVNGLDALAWRPVNANFCTHVTIGDTDTDGLCDAIDNCPAVSNLTQINFDGDSQGDACDPDDDNDAVDDAQDSQPFNNLICRDADLDTCDDCSSGSDNPANDGIDTDGEGICDAGDNCVNVANPGQEDPFFFPETVRGTAKNVFSWTTPLDFVFVVGSVANLPAYTIGNTQHRQNQSQFTAANPPAGVTRFYLVRVDCAVGTWASGGLNECPSAPNCPNGGRDDNLP